MPTNPFKPAEQVAPKVKCLIYGPSGVGKTYLALTAPGPVAVIDTEGGTAFYADQRDGLSAFDVLPTKTFDDVTEAVRYLAGNPGAYSTLVIDPVTVLYETLQDAAQLRRARVRNDRDADLEMLDWNQIKRAYKALMTDLINLPMHVIVTARERDETVKQGREFTKVGVRPDAEKGTSYYFDVVVRLTATKTARAGIVEKDRTGVHGLLTEVKAPTFDKLFGKAITSGKDATGERNVPSDADAAETDADTTFSTTQHATSLPTAPDGGLIGKVAIQGTQDFELRSSAERGITLPFRLRDGSSSVIVVAEGALAEALSSVKDAVMGQRVTAYGTMDEDSFIRDGKPASFTFLRLQRIVTPDWVLPAPDVAPVAPDGPLEAPSGALFPDADEAAEIVAREMAEATA